MFRSIHYIIPHIAAAGVSLCYAWFIFNSPYVKTGLQFVAPVILILLTHLAWLALSGQLTTGFSHVIFRRTSNTTLYMALGIVGFSLIAPQPANATGFGETIQMLLGVAVCLAMLAVVLFVLFVIFRALLGLFRLLFRNSNDDDRLNDVGTILFTIIALSVASLEGVPNFFAFSPEGHSTARVTVNASHDVIWDTMQTATSPEIPLPSLLNNFPKPTQVTVDEGTALGSNRQVKFQGREGTGFLTMRVMEHSAHSATFHVLSDTSPFANWVTHKTLTYATRSVDGKIQLDVTLAYERDLAPAWFFTPVVKFAAHLAMEVLANDVKTRAEATNGE